ncbi:hypothetical protein BJV78DRAFT_130029 [Lactifluus subvellereus]|nr:hypothetical protein BJV78DRAFT_130029 [Lactifluus subvellereus]
MRPRMRIIPKTPGKVYGPSGPLYTDQIRKGRPGIFTFHSCTCCALQIQKFSHSQAQLKGARDSSRSAPVQSLSSARARYNSIPPPPRSDWAPRSGSGRMNEVSLFPSYRRRPPRAQGVIRRA